MGNFRSNSLDISKRNGSLSEKQIISPPGGNVLQPRHIFDLFREHNVKSEIASNTTLDQGGLGNCWTFEEEINDWTNNKCSNVFKEDQVTAYLENLPRNWNKSDVFVREFETEFMVNWRTHIPAILFIGSVASIISLASVICLYAWKKSFMYTGRVKILLQIMLVLLARSIIWAIIVSPAIFTEFVDYRSVAWICNVVISCHLYTSLVSAVWMSVFTHYINRRLTNKTLGMKVPTWTYSLVSWVLPAIIISVWTALMRLTARPGCWSNYSNHVVFWIFAVPLMAAIAGNFLYLLNILKIFVGQIPLTFSTAQWKKIKKNCSILLLVPLLGVSNLLFLFSPEGRKALDSYMLFHAVLQSIQGILVSMLCCYISSDFRKACRRHLNRFRKPGSTRNDSRCPSGRKSILRKPILRNGHGSDAQKHVFFCDLP